MPATDWTQPPLPPPADRPVWPGDPTAQRRGRRLRGRAMALSFATAAAVGTGMLAADLTSHASTATSGGSTASPGTTSTGTSSTGFAQAAAPGTTSGSATVHASSGGS